jgi:hypothetical protein
MLFVNYNNCMMTEIHKQLKEDQKGEDSGCCGILGVPGFRFLKSSQ